MFDDMYDSSELYLFFEYLALDFEIISHYQSI